jgi:hypothetical protein
MDIGTAKIIIDDPTLTDEKLSVLLLKAQRLALNHYFWKLDRPPTDEQKDAFLTKYEFEIYDVARAMNKDDARDGEVSHTELGITRQWGETGKQTIDKALSALPRKAYAGS